MIGTTVTTPLENVLFRCCASDQSKSNYSCPTVATFPEGATATATYGQKDQCPAGSYAKQVQLRVSVQASENEQMYLPST